MFIKIALLPLSACSERPRTPSKFRSPVRNPKIARTWPEFGSFQSSTQRVCQFLADRSICAPDSCFRRSSIASRSNPAVLLSRRKEYTVCTSCTNNTHTFTTKSVFFWRSNSTGNVPHHLLPPSAYGSIRLNPAISTVSHFKPFQSLKISKLF